LELTDYSSFETLDFFGDENFIRYVLHPDEADRVYWAEVLTKYPHKAEMLEEASAWIMMLHHQVVYVPEQKAEQCWNKISSRISRHEHVEVKYIIPLKHAAKWLSAVAAMVLIFLSINELMEQGKQVFQSKYGELKTVNFPDESVAILNGNSHIYYVRDWRSDKPRELWMDGEASFKVKHVAVKNRFQQADSFKVHVNGIELTVLGTRFNVKNRRGQTEVSLVEGSLRIDKKGEGAFSRLMKPGDVFIYDGHQLQKGIAQRSAISSQAWTRKELEIDGYTLKDVADILEDTYGLQVSMDTPGLGDKKLSGTIPSGSADDILFVVEKVFDVNIQRNKNQVIITPKPK
jgi:transmembrane sensor